MLTLALLKIFIVILLVALNAFFVAAEYAIVSVRDSRIEQLVQQRRTGARTVQKLHRNLDEVLLANQFGVTLASLGLGWVGEVQMAAMLMPLFVSLPYAGVYAHGIAATIAFLAITYLHVILGEVVPKSLALQRAERVALAVAGPMEAFLTISHPLLAVMKRSSRLVLRAFGSKEGREGSMHSVEELKLVVTASRRVGLLPALQEDMIHRVLEMENLTVRQIMVPRPDIFALPAEMSLEEAMTRVVEEQHSRVPVYDPQRGPEHIVGVLYSKDVSRLMHVKLTKGQMQAAIASSLKVKHVMRDVLFVPETKPVSELLLEFKQRRRHLAVVVDEFGSTAGVVTVEDVLEQIVGEIEDEFDVAEQPAFALGATAFVLDGAENLRDLEVRHQLRLPKDEGFETLAGFVLTQLQRIPKVGDSFVYDNRRYTVLQMVDHRIEKVKVELEPQPLATAGDD
ncbi:MAG: hemolysin family protein [Acidobacteriota bacterium]|nr:hemolysin family protein [Acidobacteriota bacterium]